MSWRWTSINSISLGSPRQLKSTFRTSRAVDIGMFWVKSCPLVLVMFLMSFRKSSTLRYRDATSRKDSQRWWRSLMGVERLLAASAGGHTLLVVLGEMCAEGGAVFSSPGSSISRVLGTPTIWADPEPIVDEGCQWVTRRIMSPK